MTIGLQIFRNGTTDTFVYDEIDFTNGFGRYTESRGVGEIECFYTNEGEDGLLYLFYGWTLGYNNFNQYEFPTENVYGDVFIVAVDRERSFFDIDQEVIDNFFTVEDLTITSEEEEEEEDEGDLLDFIDYSELDEFILNTSEEEYLSSD